MKFKPFLVPALAGFCVSCGGGDNDFTCTARNDEVATAIQMTQEQLTELRTADARSWEWLAHVPWFGRHARLDRLESNLKDLHDEGFMLAIACGERLTRRSDLGLITVPRLNGTMLLILDRTGAMDVNARRAIGGAASALRLAGHQLTDRLATLANEYDDRTLAYPNPDASPPVSVVETPWFSVRNVVTLLGILMTLLLGWLVVRPIVRLAGRLPGTAPDLLIGLFGGQVAGSRRRRSSRVRELDDGLSDDPDED